ncbi:protein starmaker isoform X3 [Magallana gigas]|uniref:protein starmaker isoform X3 n=1 Tax=Magallana gigas TaxID=29159 RepID=UPI003340DEA2
MESVSSMKSLGAMNFYEEDCGVPAYMAVRNSVTKSELGKEHLELESNQLEDHINDIHDCQQDPDNFEVNGVCIDKEEEEEEDEGNASKVDEGGTTVCGIADVRNDEDGEITAKTGVHVQTQQTSVDVKCAKQDGGNSSKSMTKIWSDIPSNEDRDGIAKIEGVPEQAQGTTGSGVPGGVIRISNLKKGKGIAYVQNDEDGKTAAKTGVDVQTQATSDDVRLAKIDRGNSSKINEESMTKTWGDIPSNEDRNGIAKIEGVPEQTQGTTGPVCNDIPQKQQDAHINGLTSSNNTRNRKESVNAKQAGEEVEKGGRNTPKMEEDLKTMTECEDSDDVNTLKIDGATRNSKERQDGVNTSDVNSKQAGEEVEKEGGNTPKMEKDLKTRTDAVNTPEMDSTTENSKEEGQNGGNIPTMNDKQAGEEVEKEGGNTPKMEEDLKTRTECEDSDDVNTPKVNGATENSKEERQDELNSSDVNAKQAGEEVEKEGGITTKMEEDLNTRTDAVNTPEMDSTTENRKEEGQNGGNIPTVNAKQAGEEVEKGGGNTPKMEDDFKTRTECEDSDDVNTPKVDGATENSKEERQDEMNCLDVNDKQAGEEVEKGGGITPKMEEDLKTRNDAVNTPEMDSTTEDSKEEGQNGGNIPTVHHYSKQVGEEEEQGGGNTPKIDQDFKTSIDHYGECDSEQDAKNSPSCLKGTKNWRCSQRFYQKLLLGFFVLLAFAIHEANALPTKQSEYAADFRNTQKYLLCDYYRTPFFNTTSKTRCKSRCYNEAKENNCQPGFQGVCLPWVTGKGVIAGCIDTTGLHLDGKKCLLVTYVEGHNKYKAECHDEKCPNCTNANSLEERMKMCLFQNETSGDSQSIECSPENSSTRSGCVQPTCWIPGLAVVLLIVHVLASH